MALLPLTAGTAATPSDQAANDLRYARLGSPFYKLEGVTGYTGGGSNFDAVVAGYAYVAGDWYGFHHPTEGLRIYACVAGTAATASPGIIRATDYSATRQFYFTLIN